MPEESAAAVLDEPIAGTALEGSEPAANEPVADVEGTEPVAQQTPEEKYSADWRKVPEALKAFFKTPEGAPAKDAWFARAEFAQRFPGGVQEADAVRAFMDEHGGQESLSATLAEMQQSVEALKGIEEGFANGDVKTLDRFIESSPEGFNKLAPEVMARWAQTDPDTYAHTMTQVLAATIHQPGGVSTLLRDMGMMLRYNDTEGLTQSVQQLIGWANGLSERAQQAPQARQQQGRVGAPDKLAEREQQLNQREQQQFSDAVETKANSFRMDELARELEPYTKKDASPERKQAVMELIGTRMQAALNADKKHLENVKALIAKKDEAGAIRLIQSKERKLIADIAPAAAVSIYGKPNAPKVAPTPTMTRPPQSPARPTSKFDEIWGR